MSATGLSRRSLIASCPTSRGSCPGVFPLAPIAWCRALVCASAQTGPPHRITLAPNTVGETAGTSAASGPAIAPASP